MKRALGIEVALKQLRVTTTIALDTRILDDACMALDKTVSRPVASFWYERGPRRFVRVAAALALAAAVVLVALVLWNPVSEEPQPTARPTIPPDTREVETLLADERNEIETMFAALDIDGLVTMLEEGRAESKLLAASYLAEIGDERAIPALSALAGQWQGAPGENPFAQAVERINSRRPGPEPNTPGVDQEPRGQVVPEIRAVPVLSGTITDIDTGRPIESVLVHVSPSGGGRVHEVTTDNNGVYVFGAVGDDGAYGLQLTAPEHITPAEWERPRETIELRRGGQAVKDYALARGAEILATVVDESGKPINRAKVYASYVADEMGRGPKRPVRSDGEGVAALGGLRADEYLVTVAHGDYALAGQTVVLEQPGEVKSVVFVLETGIDIVGVATCSDSLPASGWRIEATPQWWHSVYSWPGDDLVAEDGTFVLPHVVPGVHQLTVYVPVEGGSRGIWSTDVNLPPQASLLDLQIPKPSPHGRVSISGTVTFPGGDYDRGFWIHARSDAGHSGSAYLGRGERQFVLTDLVPGLYDIDITVAGERKEFKNLKAPSEGIELEILMSQAVRLRATVVDRQTRQPVTRFRFRSPGERNWTQVNNPNGAFEITGRGSSAVQVMVRADGYGDKMVGLSPDANEPTVVEMGVPLAFAGTIVDEAGRAIEGATVSYRYRRSADESPEGKEITESDADGSFTVADVPANDTYHWVVFRHPDYARNMRYIKIQQDGVTNLEVVLAKGGALEGYVYDWQGELLPETAIYFMDGFNSQVQQMSGLCYATNLIDLKYTFEGVA